MRMTNAAMKLALLIFLNIFRLLSPKPQTQRGCVSKQEISDRTLAKMQCEQVSEELRLA
jgi:hypothetical protein